MTYVTHTLRVSLVAAMDVKRYEVESTATLLLNNTDFMPIINNQICVAWIAVRVTIGLEI